MNKLKHWLAFVIFWTVVGPLIIGSISGICYVIYLIIKELTAAVIAVACVGVFMLTLRWAAIYLDDRGFLPWKPKNPQ